jgi:hypothetical protein
MQQRSNTAPIAISRDRTTLTSAGGGTIFKGDNAIQLWTVASGALLTN